VLRIGLDQMASDYTTFSVMVALVAVLIFPPIFLDDYHGASVELTFAVSGLLTYAVTWACVRGCLLSGHAAGVRGRSTRCRCRWSPVARSCCSCRCQFLPWPGSRA